jgi:uncharacterized protein
VTYEPIVISLPVTGRRTSYDFYRQALSLEALGEPDEDGIPEPLQFAINAGVRVMLIRRGGFERATGGGQVPPPASTNASSPSARPPKADTDVLRPTRRRRRCRSRRPPDISHGLCGRCGRSPN